MSDRTPAEQPRVPRHDRPNPQKAARNRRRRRIEDESDDSDDLDDSDDNDDDDTAVGQKRTHGSPQHKSDDSGHGRAGSDKRRKRGTLETQAVCEDEDGNSVAETKTKPASGRKPGADVSEYARVTRSQVVQYLKRSVPADRDEAVARFLKHPDHPSRTVFLQLVPITATQLMAIWKHAQKSEFWLRARIPRKTGSDGGTLLDWNPYCNPLKQAWRKLYGEFIENDATSHGNEWEKPAGKEYMQELQRTLNRWWYEQRGYETGEMRIFDRLIKLRKRTPSSPYYLPPHARMWHIGMVVDPFNHWRGASIDGLVTIEGIPMILVEIKCPYSLNTSLYLNEPMYYIPQGQDGMYAMWRLYPSIALIHRVTFSPTYGLNVDAFAMDAAWYLRWYAPRELRYYFDPLIKMLSEQLVYRFKQTNAVLRPEPFIAFLKKECALPQPPPQPPPSSEHK